MKQKYFSHSVILLALAILTFGVDGRAQEAQEKRIGKAAATQSAVTWTVSVANAGTTLVVAAPDGRIFRKEFRPGESPEFALNENNREGLPDGTYIYELRIKPIVSAAMKEKLRAERGSDDEGEEGGNARKRSSVESLTESGSFAVVNGQPIVAGGVEPQLRLSTTRARVAPADLMFSRHMAALRSHHVSARPDEVIADDMIVQGSICVGLNCVSGEVFNYSTIKLKENNLRIEFDDISTSSGFSANDWQITANDTSSGGASKFSIEDLTSATVPLTVRAGAPNNSIFLASDGKVGFRTAVPVKDLHMNTSDTPAIRFEQNNTGGYPSQTWDLGGNEANFFVREVSGSTERLPFRIRPSAPTSSIDISADGDVGVGTATPNARLDLKQATDDFIGGLHLRRSSTNDTWALVTGADNNLYMGYATNASGANAAADFTVFPLVVTTNNRVGVRTTAPDQALSVNGDASKTGGGSWQIFSDERLKNIKSKFTPGLSAVMRLQPLRYSYKPDNALGLTDAKEHIGFRAQELLKVIPDAVSTSESGYLMVNNDPILWTMLNAIKEQQKQIEELKVEVQRLRAKRRSRR